MLALVLSSLQGRVSRRGEEAAGAEAPVPARGGRAAAVRHPRPALLQRHAAPAGRGEAAPGSDCL